MAGIVQGSQLSLKNVRLYSTTQQPLTLLLSEQSSCTDQPQQLLALPPGPFTHLLQPGSCLLLGLSVLTPAHAQPQVLTTGTAVSPPSCPHSPATSTPSRWGHAVASPPPRAAGAFPSLLAGACRLHSENPLSSPSLWDTGASPQAAALWPRWSLGQRLSLSTTHQKLVATEAG